MRTSYQLLTQYLKISYSPEELAKKLTQQGLEVEEISPYAYGLDSFIIAQIKTKIPHLGSDNLSLCTVDNGKAILNIVCGAKNFQVNDKVILAPIGSIMPSGIEIKESEIRGELSQGMLCSSKELGIFESEGLFILPADAPIGKKLIEYLNLKPDIIYDISLTPNRGDCLSTLGIAREVAILENKSTAEIAIPQKNIKINPDINTPTIDIKTTDCLRYMARIIENIQVKESPTWLKIALKKYGLHSINNIVDISNYIMMEYGQPVHIFDYDTLSLPLTVKNASKNEVLTLLSKEELDIPENLLLIADKKQNLALAGVMGGLYSGISTNTTRILLEVAYFSPDAIRRTTKATNIHTDASYRFIRNTDIDAIPSVMQALTQMILEVSSGDISPILDTYPSPLELRIIPISLDFIHKKLGFIIPEKEIQTILEHLGFTYTCNTYGDYEVTVPSYRNDCHLNIDIVEEIIRIYGYNKMPETIPLMQIPIEKPLAKTPFQLTLKELLVTYGFQEIYTFSLTKKEVNQEYSLTGAQSIPLKNPLNSDLSYLRTSLFSTVSGYLKSLVDKGVKSLHGFEVGNIFLENTNGDLLEETHLLFFQLGEVHPNNFKHSNKLVDFYDTKAVLEKLFSHLGINKDIHFVPKNDIDFLHPYKTAGIYFQEEYLGFIGEVHPKFWNDYKGKNNLILCEININILMPTLNIQQKSRTFKPISKFPKIERDLAFVLDKTITSGEIIKEFKTLSDLIISIEAIDSYEHEKLGENKRSLSFKIFFQSPTQTLTEQEIQPIIQQMINWIIQEKQGLLREF